MTDAASLIRRFEGLRLEAYLDTTGRPTVGYGFTRVMLTSGRVIILGLTITSADAELELHARLAKLQTDIRSLLKTAVTADQFAALSSLAWNIGLEALGGSTLLHKLNEGDVAGAADEFNRWRFVHIGGTPVEDPILARRRYYERLVFLGDDDPTPPFGVPVSLTKE